ncbi:4-(cytidine 5'-diphospho)-2-C-methyl-D-erythritol kinase [Oceanicella actignis]|uniref:4-diphosphocytidyl-2-C-methyl-D-erythritol kinase n=1 Tax=Oceanicella actignis TaxID=1189325 RepID=A0A1M7TJE1_9RHOB|nr:4-(cytidine 5'-diphospho)-2-C-methyl-D-erythritol kinase [Oceanicella actignis]SET66146.1 4-diphosphocytidyl-2-C-methyl-D-erythritol kinase [Oceanicella actignis]SHN70806.1 4-diphosphocytidyl-2-C-methyl-D-erythritol kinase [Oceanicella actignis]
MTPAPIREEAPAKVNLHLHVLGRRADGMHLLDSLAVFPAIGDSLGAAPAGAGADAPVALAVEGPFAGALPPAEDNLVLRAARMLRAQARAAGRDPGGAALRLTKRLPPASGVGGGSSDAAAALRALNALWALGLDDEALRRLGARLGADVPVCIRPGAWLMRGVGEALTPARIPAGLWIALVNPGVPVPTAAVFAALERRDGAPAAPLPPPEAGIGPFAQWLRAQRNDLQPAALRVAPEIAAPLEMLAAAPGALAARMSGSGATCFALFDAPGPARAAAAAARARGWWAEAGALS